MSDFLETFNLLSSLYESNTIRIQESTAFPKFVYPAAEPDLAQGREIETDVIDIRGELETNFCLEYSPVPSIPSMLTRVQIRTLIVKKDRDEFFFLGKQGRHGMHLPGGGYDVKKDHGDPCETAKREAWEEFNFNLRDVRNPHLYSWSYRKDSFVAKHVANEEDRWYGYLTILITARYDGTSDNDKPEELRRWKWYPIKELESNAFYKRGLEGMSLTEAVLPNKPGRTNLGEISYLCDSLRTLRIILSTMEIQKTYVKEVRYTKEQTGTGRAISQYSVSTSTNLTGHATRKPDRWGYGVILDGARLSKYYEIVPYNHARYKLPKQFVSKIVKLKDGTIILAVGFYGNRIVRNGEWLYDYIVNYIDTHEPYNKAAKDKSFYAYPEDERPNTWRYNPFRKDEQFETLTPDDVEDMRAFTTTNLANHALPLNVLDRLSEVIAHLETYSNFNEEEERIWVEDNLLNFIQIPWDTLVGIILPRFFEEDYNLDPPTNVNLAWIKEFATQHDLQIHWHEERSSTYADELNAGRGETAEQDFRTMYQELQPENIVNKAKDFARQATSQQLSLKQLRAKLPPAQVATAVVKKAIADHMSNVTSANYDTQYKKAFNQAVEDGLQCRILYNKKKLANAMQNLFDYYCPERPEE